MKNRGTLFVTLSACCVTLLFFSIPCTCGAEKGKATEKTGEAKAIDVEAEASTDHPEYEEGVACNDCHEMKFDAKTTATEIWLTGESPGRAAGAALRLPHRGALRAGAGPSVQPGEAARRPLRPRHHRACRVGCCALRLQRRAPGRRPLVRSAG